MSTNKNSSSNLPKNNEQQLRLNTDVNNNQNDQFDEFQRNNTINNMNTNIDEMITNHMTDNAINSNDNHPENTFNNQNTNQNPELETEQVNSSKNKKVTFDTNYSPNIQFIKEASDETKSKIKEFRSKFQTKEYLIFLRKDDFYEEYGDENCFTILDRTSKVITRAPTPDNKPGISRSSSEILKPQKDDKKLKIERAQSQNFIQNQNTDRLSQMKKLYITHHYKRIPESFEYQYLADQIDKFSKLNRFSLARFHCYSMTNSEGIFIPAVLTERPVNGPLLTFFEKVKNSRQPCSDNIRTSNFDSYNIDLTEVNSERKFILIAGITHAISFIHSKNFIHSNLNPMTVYIDENYQPKVCDYVFVPPFHITSHEDESYEHSKHYLYTYSIDKDKFDLNAFDGQLYVAPEIKNFEPNKNTNNFDNKIDIYSLGLTIFFILTEKEATFDAEGNLQYPEKFSENWKELIEKCIDKDPSKRPLANEILDDYILDKRESLISSISSEQMPLEDSKELVRYMSLFDQDKYFSIFSDMIPTINNLDDETIKIIQAAEKEEIDSLIKVGDYFLEGSHGLYQDYVWAEACYRHANSIMDEDQRKQIVEEKIGQIDQKSRTLTLQIISNEITKENILQKLAIKGKVESIEEEENYDDDDDDDDGKRKINIIFNEKKYVYKTIEHLTQNKNIENLIDTKELIIKRNQFDPLSNKISEIKPGEYSINKNEKSPFDNKNKKQSHANCYKVYRKSDKKPFFAKVYSISDYDRYSINIFKREAIIPSELNHPTIVKYVGYCEFNIANNKHKKSTSRYSLSLVQEFMPNGNLEDTFENQEKALNPTNKLKVIIGIASGMNYLFNKCIIHRDLKPANIILNENYEPVICDFEMARQFNNIKYVEMTTQIGTPVHIAPEILASCHFYKSEVDSYAFGVILYQILSDTKTDKVYTVGNETNCNFDLVNERKNSNDFMLSKIQHLQLNPVFIDLIKSCWNVEFDGRPDPPTIYKKLLNAVYRGEILIEGADMDVVKEYISRLENSNK